MFSISGKRYLQTCSFMWHFPKFEVFEAACLQLNIASTCLYQATTIKLENFHISFTVELFPIAALPFVPSFSVWNRPRDRDEGQAVLRHNKKQTDR